MCCDDGGSSQNSSAMYAAAMQNGAYAKQIADDDLAFRKQVYADSQPRQQRLEDLASRIANSQLQDAETARTRGNTAWQDWVDYGRPLQRKVVQEAQDYGGTDDQMQQAGRAVADVQGQISNQRAQNARAMAGMGVNPNSGRFAGLRAQENIMGAASAAGAATGARTAARDKGMALRAGALSGMTGQQNVAGQNMGLGLNAGNASVANSNTGFMSGLPYAQFAAGGYGTGIQAAGINNQGIGLMGNLYATQMNQPSTWGALLGAAGGLMGGAGMMGFRPFGG